MRAAKDHGAHGPRERPHVAADHLDEVGGTQVTVLDATGEARARDRDDLAALAVGLGELMVLVEAQGDVGGHDEDAPVVRSLGGGLERRLDADDGKFGVCGAQARAGGGGSRVARDHDGLRAVGDEAVDDRARKLAHLLLGLLAVRGVRGVAKVVEVLARKLRDERLEHADAAHAGIKDADKPVVLIAIAAHAALPSCDSPPRNSAQAGFPV